MAPLQGSGVMLVEHDSHLRGSMPKQLTDAERKAKNRHEAEELQMNTYKFQESSEHGMFEREDKLNEALQRYVTDVLKPRHVLEEEYIQTLERTELRKQLQSVPLTDTDEVSTTHPTRPTRAPTPITAITTVRCASIACGPGTRGMAAGAEGHGV